MSNPLADLTRFPYHASNPAMQNVAPEISQWEQDCIAQFALASRIPEGYFFDKLVHLANTLGHKHVGFGMEYPISVNSPRFSFFCNYPADWDDKYVSFIPKFIDSTTSTGKRTIPKPGYWNIDDFYGEALANNIDLAHTLTAPCPGNSTAIIGLTASNMQGWTEEHAIVLSTIAISAIAPVLLQKNLPQAFIELEPIQKIYLGLVLDGLETEDCVKPLGMSKKDIDTMRKTLNHRFKRPSIAATAWFAYRMGMLPITTINATNAFDTEKNRKITLLRLQSVDIKT